MARWTFSSLKRYEDLGLLILRGGLGFFFILHGWPKLVGGPDTWTALGKAMGVLGIDFLPVVWGFAATVAELVGGIALILGYMTRPAAALLAFTMVVAALKHVAAGDPFLMRSSRPMELAVVFIALVILGPGRHSIDGK